MTRGPMPNSLRRTLSWRLALTLLVVCVLSAIIAYRTALAEANKAHDRTLLASARAIAERIDVAKGRVVVDVPYVALDTFQIDSRGKIFYRVLDPQGRFVSGESDIPPMPADTPRSEDYPALVHFYDAAYSGAPVRIAALWQPVIEGPRSGMALVQVGETLEMRDDMARRLLISTLWQQALTVIAALGLLMLTVAATLRPLKRLQQRIAERNAASLAPVSGADLPVEIQPLVRTLNQYLERLRAVLENQRRFLDDASHQLRTSLSLVKGHVDQLGRYRDDAVTSDPSHLADIRAAIDRTVRLTNQLLTLARTADGDARTLRLGELQRIDVAGLCRDMCAEWYLAARRRGVDLGMTGPHGPAWVRGDAGMLREMLANLLDNAVRYTPAGGAVSVCVACGTDAHDVVIEDTGPGIPPEDRERAFSRFVRLGSTPEPGSGLGLAIVRQVCEAHNGAARMETGEAGGLRVRITLPAA
ncbi:sensor histidine kinase [Cupriavidus respiraculi]|uniref:histidine kinase n=1 Tax=Cupriavidus respiraculi TaxID=195930 RepID=A0ABM8WHZ3_9BURK|nr:sensor histidine kinase [Cupriavidus respiraculi]CAG9166992.1 Sensor protein QseC [Cupriavidus respiraculi]